MYSYGSPHMAAQKQDDQHEHTFSSYVRIQDVVLKTYLGRWTIGRSGERGSGISVLPARYDDDDDYWYYFNYYYLASCEYFTSQLADGLSLESKWQEVSPCLLDSSQYSKQSEQCCSLVGLDSSSDFQHFQSLFEDLRDRTNRASYDWYHRHLHVTQFP